MSKVARDQIAAPHAKTRLPPYLSARAPPAMDEIRYPHKNDDCQAYEKFSSFIHIIFLLDGTMRSQGEVISIEIQ